jgi:MoxR-like ATPase
MPDIFLSYAREDEERARGLVNLFSEQGWSVWWDPAIVPGTKFDQEIEQALDVSACVVVLWTSSSVSSKWVRIEAHEGDRRNVLIPVLLEEVKIPLAFRLTHAANLVGWKDGPHPGLDLLLDTISSVIDKPRRAKPLATHVAEQPKRSGRTSLRQHVERPLRTLSEVIGPSTYIPDPKLVDAVDLAIRMSKPLLLTGEPGAGKTHAAYYVAADLGLGAPLVFRSRPTSTSRDLFYAYDSRRAEEEHAAAKAGDPPSFIRFNALGLAIIRTLPREAAAGVVPPDLIHEAPTRSLVLIDEIDRAPRDFCNDILDELERMSFHISELGRHIQAEPSMRPIVLITSNSEKSLPGAFLRRCIYFNIPFPDSSALMEIVKGHLPELEGRLASDIVEFVTALRSSPSINKPGVADLLSWGAALLATGVDPDEGLRRQAEIAERTLSTLVKDTDAHQSALALLRTSY